MTAQTASLGDVAEFFNGVAFKEDDWGDEGRPIIRIQNLNDPDKPFNRTVRQVADRNLARNGDLLVSWAASLGVYEWRGEEACINQHIFKVIPDVTRVDEQYLRRALEASLGHMERETHGATMKHITRDRFLGIPIQLPTIPEQRRIAAILDKADALRAKRREAIAKLDQLLQSVFLDMFGDPESNPKGWPTRRIDEVADCLDRLRRPVTAKDRRPGNVPYYGANGQQGWIDKALFNEPLVLVAEDGGHFGRPERGVAYRIDGPAWVNNHAHILRARNEVLEIEYLHRALKHYNFLPFISGTTRAKLTQGQLNAAPVLLPPIQLQREFARLVERIVEMKREGERSSSGFDGLFDSIQQRAFSGAL